MLEVLLPAQQRLLGEVVATFVDGQHGALVPVVGELELGVGLILEPLLVGDGRQPPAAWLSPAGCACRR